MARHERLLRAADLLERVGLPRRVLDRYPAELAGGQSYTRELLDAIPIPVTRSLRR